MVGFFEKPFHAENWNQKRITTLGAVLTAHNGEKCTDFPAIPQEKRVWNWFCSLQDRFFAEALHKLYTTKTAAQFLERKDHMNVFFQRPAMEGRDVLEYKNVLVVGEQRGDISRANSRGDCFNLPIMYETSSETSRRADLFMHSLSMTMPPSE